MQMIAIVGIVSTFALVLFVIAFTALLLVSGWNGLREELIPGFHIKPPSSRTVFLTFLGVALPLLLLAAFTTFLAVSMLGMVFDARP